MSQKTSALAVKPAAQQVVRDIGRATRKHYSADDKIRIVLEGLPSEESIAALRCREAIDASSRSDWNPSSTEGDLAGRYDVQRQCLPCDLGA